MLARAPALQAQDLHRHGPRYYNFPCFCMICGLEKLDLGDKTGLEGDLPTMLLRIMESFSVDSSYAGG